ncbi:MAG: hypothetical protein ACPG7V_01685 [Flavobacteriaceae bacterium]
MKNRVILLFLIFNIKMVSGQPNTLEKPLVISPTSKTTRVHQDENGEFNIDVHQDDLKRFKRQGFVRYGDMGAIGNGITDDMIFIVATHALANRYGLDVKANDGAQYFIGGMEMTATIETNTDFGNASFIIDDKELENRLLSVFEVKSQLKPIAIDAIKSLRKGQEKIDISLREDCLVAVSDANVRRYIRYGLNQNKGRAQTDIFILDKKGNVDRSSPIIWDFDNITEINAIPIDQEKLTISGGRFVTLANQAPSKYTYYSRNISIKRSNVTVTNLKHFIEGEGEQGAPYRGFISISDCSNVLVKDCILTGHKTYRTIGAAGKPVSMGSYDISVTRSINVSFVNCRQTNDINDNRYWGLFASNYSKNISFDHCVFSRFDAHMGVYNATIRNSTLGYMGINAIGFGKFHLENSTVRGRSLINLRSDYGSTWEGTFTIRNCVFVPSQRKSTTVSLFSGSNSGLHDFGYTCYMPKNIVIDRLYIDDSNQNEDYKTIAIFSDFNPKMIDKSFQEQYPYVKTEKVILKNISISSEKQLVVSENPYMFREVIIKKD